MTIPEGTTLEVPADANLNIPAGKTVTNNGTVVLNGTLEGDPLTGNVTHTAHDWSADWTTNDTHHWHNCLKENCPLVDSDKDGYDVHTFKWVTTKEATSTEAGSKHEECTVCGYKKAAVAIPATGAAADPSGTPAASADNKANATATPATGDNSNTALWVFSLLAAGAALGGTYIYSRKRRHSR